MSRYPAREPRELLGRIVSILFATCASVSVHPRKGDPLWRQAALAAFDDVAPLLDFVPVPRPKRRKARRLTHG